MATVTSAGITFNTTAGNKTVVATPAAGDLIVVIAAHTGPDDGAGPGHHRQQLGRLRDDGSRLHELHRPRLHEGDLGRLDVGVRPQQADRLGDLDHVHLHAIACADSGGGLEVFRVSAMSIVGQGAIRGGGIQSNQAGATTPTPVLLRRLGVAYTGTQAALTANALISAVFNATNPAATTPRSSPAWTGSGNGGCTVPTTGTADGVHQLG